MRIPQQRGSLIMASILSNKIKNRNNTTNNQQKKTKLIIIYA
jgi:hypothetical protein